jgi:hypothetical protein
MDPEIRRHLLRQLTQGGVLLGGASKLTRAEEIKGQKLRKARAKKLRDKGKKINLYTELMHACGKKIAQKKLADGRYEKYAKLTGDARSKARFKNKDEINKCIAQRGLKLKKYSKKKYLGGAVLKKPMRPMRQKTMTVDDYMRYQGRTCDDLERAMAPYNEEAGQYEIHCGMPLTRSVKDSLDDTWLDQEEGIYNEGLPQGYSLAGGAARKKRKTKTCSPWIAYVKLYAKKHKLSYSEALQRAGPSYRKLQR